MKIRKMTAHFGALDGAVLELSDGLSILYAPNESGKSTWCAFLRAMLFGVDTAQRARAGQKPDRLKYRPWNGTPMSGSLELTAAEAPVTIRRWTERDNRPMQAFSATVTGTDIPVRDLDADNAGEKLTGMPVEVFERTVFIRQSGLEVSGDPELERRISAIVTSGDEEISFTESEKRLRSWLRHRRSGKRGAIPELQAELDETRRVLGKIREHERAAAEADEEIMALEEQGKQTEARMLAARALQRKRALAEMAGARASVLEAEELRRTAEDDLAQADGLIAESPFGQAEPDEASSRAHKDAERAEALFRFSQRPTPAALSVILLILSLAAFALVFLLPWRTVCVGAGCALILLFAAAFARRQRLMRRKAEALAERRRLLAGYGAEEPSEILSALEEYRGLWQRRQEAFLRAETAGAVLDSRKKAQRAVENEAMEALDFSGGDNDAARAARELEDIRARLNALRERRAMAEGQAKALGDPPVLESVLAEGERRYVELLRQEEALTLALETLSGADDELQTRLSPLLAKKAAAYFSELTGGRYDEVTLARDLSARARVTGDDVGRELEDLSAGAKDQLYLSLRLAVCDLALPEDDPCPVILDDALVTFDQERMALALDLMKRIAQKRQVIIFSCHTRETEYFAGDDDVAKITLKNGE